MLLKTTKLVCIIVAVLLTQGHSWYDAFCCNDKDCAPVLVDSVKWTPDGWYIKQQGNMRNDEVVPFNDPRIRESKDHNMHMCQLTWEKQIRCLYVPPGGG